MSGVSGERFEPPFYLRNRHLQSVLNSLGPRRLRAARCLRELPARKILLTADDGTRLPAEYDCIHGPAGDTPLAILLHGWEGSARSPYVVATARKLLHHGFDVLRLNLRDHGDSHHLNRELFNSTRTVEVAGAIADFFERYPYRRRLLAGFSLGGSFALRIAADAGSRLELQCAVGVCPPLDPANAMRALNEGWFAYERYFYRRWRDSLARKLRHYPDLGYADLLPRARSVDDLNRLFIPRYTPFSTVEDYFAAYALTGDRLSGLKIPSYLIMAEDDPIIPRGDLENVRVPAALTVELHRWGGHCGFIRSLGAQSWLEERLPDLLSRH